ncbi:hypothetical protein BH10PSE16_BH10PSE16_25890 [soil metagenome]
MKKHAIRVLGGSLPMMILAAGSLTVALQAAAVQAPPRPPGSDRVIVEAGMSPKEVLRQKRAHNHSRQGKKDFTRDDTLDVHPVFKLPATPRRQSQSRNKSIQKRP